MLTCPECMSDKLVWHWSDGDVVCTSCGLVVEERFIDDRVAFKDYGDYSPLEAPVNKQVLKKVNVMNANLFNGMMEETTEVAKAVDDFCKARDSSNASNASNGCEGLSKADIASGIYATTKGLSIKDVCCAMDMKPKKMWKAVIKHKIINDNRTCDVLKRSIYRCDDIPSEQKWDVLKVAKKFLEALENNVLIQRFKTDKMIVSLMTIACEVAKVDIKRRDFCRKYGITIDTLKKHEALLQEALKSLKTLEAPKIVK